MIIKSDDIKIMGSEPVSGIENCFRGIVREINPSEYGIEVTIEAGEIFYVDLPVCDFKSLQIGESSNVWITFPKEAAVALPGSG